MYSYNLTLYLMRIYKHKLNASQYLFKKQFKK